jgi:aminopeptidase N
MAGRARRGRGNAGGRVDRRAADTRPIRTKVETPDEINEVFDGIAYQKTASVLRTIENYVGPEAFRQGVAAYLKKYSFANAVGRGLLDRGCARTGQAVDGS